MSVHFRGMQDEAPMVRTAIAQSNALLDVTDANRRKRDSNGVHKPSIYPGNNSNTGDVIKVGQLLFTRIGNTSNDSRLAVCASLAGAGAEEAHAYPDDFEMALTAIKSKYNYMGIAADGFNLESPVAQGFPIAFGGTFSLPIANKERFEPGQIVRAELAIPDRSIATNAKNTTSRLNLSTYPWRVVPEDYTSPGNLLYMHYTNMLEDNKKWASIVNVNGSNFADRWLTYGHAKTNSILMSVLLGLYPMLKMNLFTVSGIVVQNPYVNQVEKTETGGLLATMQADEIILRLATLFGLIEGNVYESIDPKTMSWFKQLARIIVLTVCFNPKNRTMEFGQRQNKLSNTTRNSKTGAVQRGTPAGEFLNLQINHDRVLTGATLQALDDHVQKRVGRVISGPNREKLVDVILEKSHL